MLAFFMGNLSLSAWARYGPEGWGQKFLENEEALGGGKSLCEAKFPCTLWQW